MVMGTTNIHEDVFREIARLVLEGIDGIYCYEPKGLMAPFLGEKSIKPSIAVKWPSAQDEECQNQIAFEIKIAVLYGAAIPQIVGRLRRETAEQVQKFTGYDVTAVDIYITRLIRFEKERSGEEHDQEAPGNHQNAQVSESTDGEYAADSD